MSLKNVTPLKKETRIRRGKRGEREEREREGKATVSDL
jgi:hypothetical protein